MASDQSKTSDGYVCVWQLPSVAAFPMQLERLAVESSESTGRASYQLVRYGLVGQRVVISDMTTRQVSDLVAAIMLDVQRTLGHFSLAPSLIQILEMEEKS